MRTLNAANTLHRARNRTDALINLLYQDGVESAKFQAHLDAAIAELTSLRTNPPSATETAASLPFFSK